jgi:putative SOS response-associated peptidase YedK
VPSRSNDPSTGPKPINARSDSLDKPTFREAFRSKWCLIPADGFFEWSTVGGKKRATHFRMRDRSLFAFAGLWEFWTDGAEKLATCCIITTDANELVGTIHNRMPVMLPKANYASWLSAETGIAEVQGMLRPYPADEMEAVAVGPAINSPRNEGPDLLNSA